MWACKKKTLLFFSELIHTLKFSVLIFNMVNINRYNTHKQKLFGVFNKFKSLKESCDRNVLKLLL